MNIRISPNIRLLSLLLSSSILVFSRHFLIVFLFFSFTLTGVLVASTRRNVLARLRPLLFIGLLILFFQLVFNREVPLNMRIVVGLIASLKVMTLSMLVFLFTSTTSPSEIVRIFEFLPPRFRLALTVCFSMLPIVLLESSTITAVQASRGQKYKGINIYKSIIPVIVPLLHRTIQRALHLVQVMFAKGYVLRG